MPLIEEKVALRYLRTHLPALHGAILGGWDDWTKHASPEMQAVVSTTARAAAVHDFQVRRAARYFETQPRCHVLDRDGLVLFIVGDRIAIRLKKFNDQFRSENQPTKQVRDFRAQQALPGIRAAHHIEAGYKLDRFQQEIEWIGLVCPNNDGIFWQTEITAQEARTSIQDLFESAAPTAGGTTFKRRAPNNVITLKPNGTRPKS